MSFQAFDDSVCVASAHWLNDVLSEQKMFPPRNPLHYPVAFKETPEWCKGLVSRFPELERSTSFYLYLYKQCTVCTCILPYPLQEKHAM